MIIQCLAQSGCTQRVELLIGAALTHNKPITLAYEAPYLDIDTPGKDSYELFASGLDFAMLVTDKHRYLKSEYEVAYFLPSPPVEQWVVQIGKTYPADAVLIFSDTGICCDDNSEFALDEYNAVITWLEKRYANLTT